MSVWLSCSVFLNLWKILFILLVLFVSGENNLTDIECVHFRKGMREMADDVAMRRDALHWKVDNLN